MGSFYVVSVRDSRPSPPPRPRPDLKKPGPGIGRLNYVIVYVMVRMHITYLITYILNIHVIGPAAPAGGCMARFTISLKLKGTP